MNTDTSKDESAVSENGPQESGEKPAAAGAEGTNGSGLEGKVTELQDKLQEQEKKYLYLFSEFENFRRRTERDRIEFVKFGHESFLRELLQVMDNFERALTHAESFKSEKGDPLSQVCQGVEMIHHQFLEAMKAQGAVPIASLNAKFDPNLHEAVGEEEADAETGTIVKELQKGYMLHGRLLRPARVIVAKKKV